VRLTALHPDPRRGPGLVPTVVEVERGLPVSRLRPELARLTGWAGWSSGGVRLAVDDAQLDDTHQVGTHPLVAGCGLRPGTGSRPEAERALDAPLHVAVVAGPDCGRLHPVEAGAETVVRGLGSVGPHDVVLAGPVLAGPVLAGLVLADPALGTVRVRCTGGRVTVRVDRPATLVRAAPRWWQRRGGRVVAVRRRGRFRWRPDDELRVGTSTLALRVRSGPAPSARPAEPRLRTGGRSGARTAGLLVLGPLAGSVALAVALRQPLLLLTAATGPLALLAAGRAAPEHSPAAPAASTGPVEARDVADLVAGTVRALDGGTALHGTAPWDVDGVLAVVGPRADALAVARAIVLGELGTHARPTVTVRTREPADWSWADAVARTGDEPATGAEGHVVVVDLPRVTDETAERRSGVGHGRRLLLVLPSRRDVPAWCRCVLEVGPASARLRGTSAAPPWGVAGDRPGAPGRRTPRDGGWRAVPLQAVSTGVAGTQVTRAVGVREVHARTLDPAPAGGDDLPARVSLGALPGVPTADADAVSAAWDAPRAGLAAPLGRAAGLAPVVVDLVADGPHALVAGTTGAGKSELLTTWVLAAALRHPPERLAVLLVDFKGGAGLGTVAGLPHVVDHVTDLDEPRARRVLAGLRAELRRRERLLADHAARDVADLDPADPAAPPRLLVVVDELRALVDDVPDAMPALVRIAAQGRALGVHLVLATQRPAGAVSADLRANTTLRIALRVADPADSVDVVEVPDAAALSPSTPGRALLLRAAGAAEPIQVAQPGGPADAGVTLARPWPAATDAWTPEVPSRTPDDHTAAWVGAAVSAAAGRPARPVPWLPALTDRVMTDDVAPGPGLAVAVADLPDQQRRAPVRWDPGDGHLLVLGGPGSGRTTTLLTVGVEALRAGLAVHAVGLPSGAAADLRAHDVHGLVGTVARSDEPVRVARLVELLSAGDGTGAGDGAGDGPRAVLLVDGLETALDALGSLARGAGADRLSALWRSGRSAVAVVAGADVAGSSVRHGAHFRDRLVLRVADASLDAVAGVPAALAGVRPVPGRAVHAGPAGAVLCQVALPGPATAPAATNPTGRPGPVVVRVEALPRFARRPARLRADATGVPIGVGGDDAAPVRVDVGPGLLVAGPPGSGRSTVLAAVAQGLTGDGGRVLRLVDRAAGPVACLPGVVDLDLRDGDVAGALDGPGAWTVLVDDLDEVERAHPELVDTWGRWSGPHRRLVAATTSAAAAGAFRGLAPALLRLRRAVVLDVHDPASAEIVGGRAAWLADPADRPVGRGVVVLGRTATPVQVYAWEREGPTAGPGPSP